MLTPAHIRLRSLLSAAAVALVVTSTAALAMHRETPFLVNLSNSPGGVSTNPAPPQGEPNRVYFQSVSDLKHNGSSGSEIFFYVLRPDVQDSGILRQITNFAGESQNPASSQAGWSLAFDSNADIIGTGNDIRQIFLFLRKYGTFIQLTNGEADSTNPSIDYNGYVVAFESQADLKGSGAPMGYTQIYMYDLLGGLPPCDVSGCHHDPNRLIQVTNWAGNSTHPVVAAQGRYIFFQSDVFGYQQIFVFDRGDGGRITQLTNGFGDSSHPAPDGTGNFVGFQSTADLLGLGSAGSQIYYFDRERNDLRQVTQGGGDSMKPSLGAGSQTLSFVSSADLLGTGASGQHLFFFDPHTLHMYQVTRDAGTTSDNPFSAGNFILFDTDEDIMRVGMSGRQVYSVNTFGRTQKIGIGKRIVGLLPQGQLTLNFGDRDGRSEGTVQLLSNASSLPPTPVPGFGTFCMRFTGDGQGVFDCRGNRPGGDLFVTQDHDTSDVDFTCALAGSCREGNACRLPLLSPHRKPCPACVNGTCSGGPNAGAACFENSTCLLNQTCVDGGLGVCNGPVRTQHTGFFLAGGVQMMLPLSVSLSIDAGRDGSWCTTDDAWVFQGVNTSVEVTTGMATTTIMDANDAPASAITATDTGGPFECFRLERGNFQNAALVGGLPLLDVPTDGGGLQDVVVPIHLTARAGAPYQTCTSLACRVITFCTADADCDDGSVCNGAETCVNNSCTPGSSLVCDNGNACDGTETCDPVLGCQAGAAPTCDDGALCTADSCDSGTGSCLHIPLPGCCLSDADCRDIDVCNGAEHCVSGNCVAGSPLVCDNGNACDGLETCEPPTGCVPGVAPNCNDGARCTTDACNPALGCTHTSVSGCCTTDADCRDTNLCNGAEGCLAGDCVPGTPLVCGDNNVCTGEETCDQYNGCLQGNPLVCLDDGAPCTAESCDAVNGCVHTSISGCCTVDTDCQNTNACDGLETCVAGDCFGGVPLVCTDGNVCNGIETCIPTLGCVSTAPLACGDDGALCTADSCDATLGCVHTPISGCCLTDVDCQDVSACNGLERCVNGDCVPGTPLFCGDDNACNGAERCDDTLGCQPGTAPDQFSFEGVQCTLDLLWDEYNDTNPGAMGGRNRYTALRGLLIKMRKKFGYVSPKDDGRVTRSIIKPKAAVRILRVFERRLVNGMRNGIVDPVAGTTLHDLSQHGITSLLEFDAQAPRPEY